MMSLHRVLRTAAVGIAVSAATATGLAAAAPAATAATCSVAWGSTPKTSVPMTQRDLVNVRSGRHACYDRLVVDLNGWGSGVTGYDVRYVDNVYQDGSGQIVPLRGGAKLQIVIKAPAYDTSGELIMEPDRLSELSDVTGFSTFRQVAYAGSFEGQTTIGLGVRARLPMRVFRLEGPELGQRVVIDVAHAWN
jgi:hypothetical protein